MQKKETMKTFVYSMFAVAVALLSSCKEGSDTPSSSNKYAHPEKRDLAVLLASLPMGAEQVCEVYDAVSASSSNGYDEEYMMKDLLGSPGSGVGDGPAAKTRAASRYGTPLRDLISACLASRGLPSTRSGASEVEAYLDGLSQSDLQIYWPYSEDWDGSSMPVITFDPGYGAESNYGYVISGDGDGYKVVDSLYIDENVARERPVWVINSNDDSSFLPLELCLRSGGFAPATRSSSVEEGGTLYMKDFVMHRNYDTWFAGASEFYVRMGTVNNFHALSESELKQYRPEVTDFVVVVRRKMLGKVVPFDAVLVTGFSEQLDKLPFMITEDDGGTQTSWKCSAAVKVKSKTYGFDIDIPYRTGDDIVWRGQLAASWFASDAEVRGNFGDVSITFALE